jgi:translation elongation factor EF-1alpha
MEIRVGKVTHYFDRISVAVLNLTEELKVGDTIHIHGHLTDFNQRVGSMEIEHQKLESAGPGKEIALKVLEPVKEGDIIYKVKED